jgi:hypothetical protein
MATLPKPLMPTVSKLDAAEIEARKEAAGPAPAPTDVPTLGEKVLLQGVYGRMLHPETQGEVDIEKVSPIVFDWWWAIQFKAGKVRRAVF